MGLKHFGPVISIYNLNMVYIDADYYTDDPI